MPPEEARKYLLAIRATLSETPGAHTGRYVAAIETALSALYPPKDAGRCAWVFIPAAELTPYKDVERVATLSHRMDGLSPETALTLDGDERNLVYTALICYHAILYSVHRERLLEGVENVLRALGKSGLGGEETLCCQD